MKQTRNLMGMPITIEVVGMDKTKEIINQTFDYFEYVDKKFSPYKEISEVTRFNNGILVKEKLSKDLKEILKKAKETKEETNGYFDVYKEGFVDPSGIVKGWAIYNAAKIVKGKGFKNYCIEAGGDMEVSGENKEGEDWRIGIRNPFKKDEIVKAIKLNSGGVATSGLYERGHHIYNPKNPQDTLESVASLTVVGPNIYEADRFVTAAFAMGEKGIYFIEELNGYEGYMIKRNGTAKMTSGFNKYEVD